MTRRRPRPLLFLVALLALALDQGTKAWAVAALKPVAGVTLVPGGLDLVYVENTGIAFGMFAGYGLLLALAVVALGLLGLAAARGLDWSRAEPNVIGGCLAGGALGNLLDRWRHGFVVDFFDAHLGPHHWPVFNVADSLICVAVGWIVLRQWFGPRAKPA